jgi:hypothetical protein
VTASRPNVSIEIAHLLILAQIERAKKTGAETIRQDSSAPALETTEPVEPVRPADFTTNGRAGKVGTK